jgi:rRNA processing protein Gar1
VVDSSGEKVGTVDEVLGDQNADIFDGLAVATGLVGKPVYVPAERVGPITEGRVQLELTADAVERLEPYEPPDAL